MLTLDLIVVVVDLARLEICVEFADKRINRVPPGRQLDVRAGAGRVSRTITGWSSEQGSGYIGHDPY
jgi:hypothetical protein